MQDEIENRNIISTLREMDKWLDFLTLIQDEVEEDKAKLDIANEKLSKKIGHNGILAINLNVLGIIGFGFSFTLRNVHLSVIAALAFQTGMALHLVNFLTVGDEDKLEKDINIKVKDLNELKQQISSFKKYQDILIKELPDEIRQQLYPPQDSNSDKPIKFIYEQKNNQ